MTDRARQALDQLRAALERLDAGGYVVPLLRRPLPGWRLADAG
jgi:hypothetical protein